MSVDWRVIDYLMGICIYIGTPIRNLWLACPLCLPPFLNSCRKVVTPTLHLTHPSSLLPPLPDAYERLILDCVNGDRRLFIRNDELEVAWEKFTPVLKEIEQRRVAPELYPYGSRGPVGAHYLAAKYGVRWGDHNPEDL